MEKYGFVYLWYDRKHKRYYIGCRWGTEDDGYICSSSWMKKAYRIRPEDFKRRILSRIYTNKKDLLEEEYRWLSKTKTEELGKRYYNIYNHHFGHWSTNDEERESVSNKLSERNRGQGLGRKLSDETKRKIGDSKRGNTYSLGIKRTEETKKKLSESAKKRKPTMLGKKQTEETRLKISLALKGRPKSKEHCENLSRAHKKS